MVVAQFRQFMGRERMMFIHGIKESHKQILAGRGLKKLSKRRCRKKIQQLLLMRP